MYIKIKIKRLTGHTIRRVIPLRVLIKYKRPLKRETLQIRIPYYKKGNTPTSNYKV